MVNRKSRAIFAVRCASTDKPSNRHVKNAPGDYAVSEKKRRENPQTVSLFAESTIENFLARWNSISADWLSCLSFNNTSYMDDREKQDCHVLRAWENA
jgi:hypothetical protein